MRWLSIACLACIACASVACSSNSSNETNETRVDAAVDAHGEVSAEAAPFVCNACSTELSGDPAPASWQCIKTLDAQVVELDGKPIEGVVLMACSPARCVHNDSDAEGKVHLEQCAWLSQPSFRVVGFDQFVQFAIPLRNPATEFTFTNVPLVHLPAAGIAIDVGKAQKLSQNGATLELVAGENNAAIDSLGAYADFRAVEYPAERMVPGLDGGHGFGVVYELGPQDTELSPPAKLTLPNRQGWAAGTAVEFYLQNYDTVKDMPVNIGEWYLVSGGTVSADGATIVTDVGIPRLSLVAVRKKP
jgi:hypothetical protein